MKNKLRVSVEWRIEEQKLERESYKIFGIFLNEKLAESSTTYTNIYSEKREKTLIN